jgi:hypothetical protein
LSNFLQFNLIIYFNIAIFNIAIGNIFNLFFNTYITFSNNFDTIFGLAFHPVSFITCQTKNPKVLVLPHLYCSTIAGFFFSTFFTIFFKSSSPTAGASNHFSDITSFADFPFFNISSITIFIWLSIIFHSSDIFINSINLSMSNGKSCIHTKFSFMYALIGPEIHFAMFFEFIHFSIISKNIFNVSKSPIREFIYSLLNQYSCLNFLIILCGIIKFSTFKRFNISSLKFSIGISGSGKYL